MVDETTNTSNQEQVTLFLRWVDDQHEEFIGLHTVDYITSDSTDAVIEDALNLPLSKARGHCNDGASNTNGVRNGVAVQICKKEHRAVTFTVMDMP